MLGVTRAISTQDSYAEIVAPFKRWCSERRIEWAAATTDVIMRYLAEGERRGLHPNTLLNQSFAIEAHYRDIGRNLADHKIREYRSRLTKERPKHKTIRKPLRRMELEQAFVDPPVTLCEFRDRALTVFGYVSGWALGEAMRIRMSGVLIDEQGATVTAGSTRLRIHRGRTELCPVKVLDAYIERRGGSSGLLFCVLQGKNTGQPLGAQNVIDMLRRIAVRGGINAAGICYSSLREGARLDRNETLALGL